MFHSVSRAAVSFVFVLALLLSCIPAQAQIADFEAPAFELQDSLFSTALGWLQNLLFGDNEASVMTMGGRKGGDGYIPGTYEPVVGTTSSSCIDPMGNPCIENP